MTTKKPKKNKQAPEAITTNPAHSEVIVEATYLDTVIPSNIEEIDLVQGFGSQTWRTAAEVDVASAKNKCVKMNISAASIKYSSAIETSREITTLKDEEIARAWLVSRLVNTLGYEDSRIKLESEYVAGRTDKTGQENSVRIDVIVEDEKGTPFYFIEVKAPDKFENELGLIERQLFSVAALHASKTNKKPKFLVYYTIEEIAGQLRDKAIVIDYEKFPTYAAWTGAGMPSVSDALSEKYDRPKKTPYVRKGSRDLKSQFRPSEVKDLATNLHNVLWGGGSTGDTEVFTSLVNIILAKIQDEYDTPDDIEYKFQVFQHGDIIEAPHALYDRLNEVYRTALKKQLGKDGDLSDQHIVNKEKFPLAKLVFTVGQMEKYSFVDGKNSLSGKDLLGDFFEQIQRDGFKQSKGQFFTPVNIVRFMLYALEIDNLSIDMLNNEQKLPLIIDPSCGSATFLIETMKMVTSEVKRRQRSKLIASRQIQDAYDSMFMPDHKEHKWAREFLYGIEHNFDLATAAKVNMILHGDGSTNIFHKDGLKPFSAYETPAAAGSPNVLKVRTPCDVYGKKDANGQFHVIISNPPFSVDLDKDTKETLGVSFLFGGKKNSENLFIERYWQLLKDGGRMAIVLPESIFDTTENKYIRLFLFKYFHVRSVISLPQLAFEPYTQTKTSILFAQKKSVAEIKRWNKLWNAHSSEYEKLCRRIHNYYKVFVEGDSATAYPSIKSKTPADAKTDVSHLLGVALTQRESTMSITDYLKEKKHFVYLFLEVDTDAVDVFGRVNCSWVMRRVLEASVLEAKNQNDETLDQDGAMFLAEANAVGYKRSKRGERVQPNDLFNIEVAPSAVVKKSIVELYERGEADLTQRLKSANKRLSDASAVPKASERISGQVKDLEKKKSSFAEERIKVISGIEKFYDVDGNLLSKHRDREDAELKAIFSMPLMMHLRSDAILLNPKLPTSILDHMRSKGLWK